MKQFCVKDTQNLQRLVASGSDPEATRLVYELVNLSPDQKRERIRVLLNLAERYLILGLLQEDGPWKIHTVDALVERRVHIRCFFPPLLRDECALEWYQEAMNNFVAVNQDQGTLGCCPDERYQLFQRLGILYALLGEHNTAIQYLYRARTSTSDPLQHAHLSYLSGLVLCVKGDKKAAIHAFSDALPRL